MSPSLDWTGLSDIIAQAEATGATIGACVIPARGDVFTHRGDRRFVAASTVKVPIMIELFRQVDAGRQNLDATHSLRPEDKSAGSGIVAHLHEGIALTLADLAYLMMSISDNSATNILIDRLGPGQVNETMRDLGMAGSVLGRKMQGRAVLAGEGENWAVPNDYARVMASLLNNQAASAASCARMVALLEQQQNDRRIARHLPRADRPRWGSKTGSLPGVVNDVGFIMTAHGPVILAVFCEGVADPHAGEQVIGAIAKAAVAAAGP